MVHGGELSCKLGQVERIKTRKAIDVKTASQENREN